MGAKIQPLHPPQPVAEPLQDHALDRLREIRETMALSTKFTSISGIGALGQGCLALLTSYWTWQQVGRDWLLGWALCGGAALALGIGSTYVKARRTRQGLFGVAGRRFLKGLFPALLAGGFMSFVAYDRGYWDLLPGVWMLLYGIGVVAAGMHSARIVSMMGYSFLLLAVPTLMTPVEWSTLWMACGFGGLHVVFGIAIARRYGG
ncbi:MAG: hypothetical protein AAF581_14855 [Planctomycetota bacterium]